MRILLLVLISFLIAFRSDAQSPEKSVKGTFYVSVDDFAFVFVNGMQVYRAGIGETRSPEVELKTGDRVVVQLHDKGGERWFAMAFASSDGQSVVSFRNHDYKIIPDLNVTDFKVEQCEKWKYAKDIRRKVTLPVKSSSESVWGDLNTSILGAVVTSKMFSARSK
jgi:hypothetical protein